LHHPLEIRLFAWGRRYGPKLHESHVRNVLHGQQDQLWVFGIGRERSSVEQYAPSAKSREGMFHLIVVNKLTAGQDIVQHLP